MGDNAARGSTEILIDTIKRNTDALRALIAAEKAVQKEVAELRTDIGRLTLMEDREREVVDRVDDYLSTLTDRRAGQSELIKIGSSAAKSAPVQTFASVLILWLAAKLGVLQYLFGGVSG